jgi:hypothetical protein
MRCMSCEQHYMVARVLASFGRGLYTPMKASELMVSQRSSGVLLANLMLCTQATERRPPHDKLQKVVGSSGGCQLHIV